MWRAPTLNEVLASLGLTTAPAEFGAKRILDSGVEVFCGGAGEVWAWLRDEGEIRSTCRECLRSHEKVELDLSGCCEDCHDELARSAKRRKAEDDDEALSDYRTAPARAILSVANPHIARCARRAYEVGADRWQHDDLNRHGLAHVAAWADDALRAVSL